MKTIKELIIELKRVSDDGVRFKRDSMLIALKHDEMELIIKSLVEYEINRNYA